MADSDYTDTTEDGKLVFVLHDACESGDVVLLRELLAQRIQDSQQETEDDEAPEFPLLNLKDANECTPLHLAILNGRVPCVELLLKEARADVCEDCDGCPPLHMAVCAAALKALTPAAASCLDLLLEAGADPYQRDDMSRTAFHWAAQLGQVALAQKLFAAAAAAAARTAEVAAATGQEAPPPYPPLTELPDNQDDTPLHVAVRFRHLDMVLLLLEQDQQHKAAAAAGTSTSNGSTGGGGAGSISQPAAKLRNKQGHYPLHTAAFYGFAAAVQPLLQAFKGAVVVKDKRGATPAELAGRRGHKEVATALDLAAAGVKKSQQQQQQAVGQQGAVQPAPAAAGQEDGKTGILGGGTTGAGAVTTLVVAPMECNLHYTCPQPVVRGLTGVPPENTARLAVLVEGGRGILRSQEFEGQLTWVEHVVAAPLGDVLRVHEWNYIRNLQTECLHLPSDSGVVGHLDPDTAISHHSFQAALRAAAAVCLAVDRVVAGSSRHAFCAVRPPGHHAGPRGVVPSARDKTGSHGFCLLNNVAIAASYAMNVHRHAGIQRVAILDFDVHHGNGTEACVAATAPRTLRYAFKDPLSEGVHIYHTYQPWLDVDDDDNIFFASVQGFGRKVPSSDVFVYPGSGATCDNIHLKQQQLKQRQLQEPAPMEGMVVERAEGAAAGSNAAGGGSSQAPGPIAEEPALEDPDHEFIDVAEPPPPADGPRIIDVGIPGPGFHPLKWRRAWRDKVLPALANFKPDLILISAGFDAHRKDEINFRYIGATEADYEWLTDQIVQIANRDCPGRVVSALEGGYNINGGIVSAFARSVAAHVRALTEQHGQLWDPLESKIERELEHKRQEERLAKAAARAAAAAAKELHRKSSATEGAEATPAAAGALDGGPGERPEAAAGGGALAGGEVGGQEGVAGDAGRSKRRRTGPPVDYVALNAQLEAEKGDKGGGGGGGGATG